MDGLLVVGRQLQNCLEHHVFIGMLVIRLRIGFETCHPEPEAYKYILTPVKRLTAQSSLFMLLVLESYICLPVFEKFILESIFGFRLPLKVHEADAAKHFE